MTTSAHIYSCIVYTAMLISLMSSCAFSQGLLQIERSVYGYRDTVVKAIFESGRKSKVETVYQPWKDPITIAHLAITKYYRQNDSLIVHTTYRYPTDNPRAGSEYEISYYDSHHHLIGSETIKDNSYNRNDYTYDNAGRITRHVVYSDSNTITYLRETEYNDKERFFVERGSPYTKTYYDSLGEYTISYSAPDSSKDWTDTVEYKKHGKYGKLWNMAITGQISIAPDPDASVIDTVIHEFDSENRPTKISFIHENKNLIKTTNYIYAFDGKMSEENTVRANGDTVYRHIFFYDTYDKTNRLLTRQTGSGESSSILSNKYDDRGDLIECKYVDKGVLIMLSKYTYEY